MEHHAQLLTGSFDAALSLLAEELNVDFSHIDPDIVSETYVTLGVAEVHAIKERAHQSPFVRTHRVFVICTETVTHEAQNALLKLMEEPPPHSKFFVCMPSAAPLLETLRSRLSIRALPTTSLVASSLWELPVSERMRSIARHVDTPEWGVFVRNATEALSVRISQSGRTSDHERTLFALTNINRRGASSKMLLEYLALYVTP